MNRRHQFVAVCFLGLTLVTTPAAHLRIFVLSGQSNALGTTADTSESDITPGADPADANTPFFWSNRNTSSDNFPAGIIGDSDGLISYIQA